MKYFRVVFFLICCGVQIFALERSRVMMGTYISISSENADEKLINEAFDEFKRVDVALSNYKTEAECFRLNKFRELNASDMLIDALQKSLYFYKKSDGYFDITVGSITKELFHFGEDERLVSKSELKKAIVAIDGIKINRNNITLEDGVYIDFGGIGKGYAVDLASRFLQDNGIKDAVVAASGDVRCLSVCDIYIESPFKEATMFAMIGTKIDNIAVSTSGDYRRFVKNRSNNHIINPKKKKSASFFASVTLLTVGDNTSADAFATAIAAMDGQKGVEFAKSLNGYAYLLIANDGRIFKGNLEKFAKKIKIYRTALTRKKTDK